MRLRFSWTVAFLLAAISLLPAGQLSARAGEAKPEHPSTAPAAETRPAATANPDFEAGRALARKDLAAGILGEKLAVPEAFMLQWMDQQDEDANLLDYYKAMVADRFGVRCETEVIVPNYGNRDLNRAKGYNQEMESVLEKRYGHDVLDKAWKEACATPGQKRAAYLKSRAAAPPTTQPASTRNDAQTSPWKMNRATRPSTAIVPMENPNTNSR